MSRPQTNPQALLAPVSQAALAQPGLALLLAMRWRVMLNTVTQAVHAQPLRIVGTMASIVLIWAGLYILLLFVFDQVQRSVLEGIVAMPLIFTFFFMALTAMLAFSNAILCYGGLFRRKESEYLLVSPITPRDLVIIRYIESLLLSSWSLLLLGLPLMMAIARVRSEPWSFYPLFLGLFLSFIPIPGALGLLAAWILAMVCPKTPGRAILLGLLSATAVGGWWVWGMVFDPVNPSEWLKHLYDRLSLVQNAMLPHTWVSNGITSALQGQAGAALFYLAVTAANAAFLSVVAIGVVSGKFVPAYARAQVGSANVAWRTSRIITAVAEVLFAYLPQRQRLLAAKDLRSFFRDPLQWSQMAILLGLLALYLTNVQKLWVDLSTPALQALVGFLNLTAVSLILATFTSRFVYPLVSLEAQQLWLLGLLPLSRTQMITAKFLYALTITLAAAVGVMAVSVYRLNLPGPLALAHVISISSICIGLCGVSIGVGARLPVFNERNPARIAGGFGGTVGLLCSVGLVVLSLVGVAMMSLEATIKGYGEQMTGVMIAWLVGVVVVNLTGGAVALFVGTRYFSRVEV